jgi:hypothetical protein
MIFKGIGSNEKRGVVRAEYEIVNTAKPNFIERNIE